MPLEILAALRNLVITLIHRQGSTQIAVTRRWFAFHPEKALAVLLCVMCTSAYPYSGAPCNTLNVGSYQTIVFQEGCRNYKYGFWCGAGSVWEDIFLITSWQAPTCYNV